MNTYLLEKSRLAHQAESERNFHVFYQLIEGSSSQQREDLYLHENIQDYHYLNQSGCFAIPGVSDKTHFDILKTSLSTIGIDSQQQHQIFSILSCILQLGNIQFKEKENRVKTSESDTILEIINKDSLQVCAKLLGIDEKKLEKTLLTRDFRGASRGSVYAIPLDLPQAQEARDALAKALYANLFNWLVDKINLHLHVANNIKSSLFIGILDIFGFEIFDENSFEQLLINFANEKLQNQFNKNMFEFEQQEYLQEGIVWSEVSFLDNQFCVDLIEKKPFGILPLLDEECQMPKGSDLKLLDKLKEKHTGNQSAFSKHLHNSNSFYISHFAGRVLYNINNFIEKNKDTLPQDIEDLLQSSNNEFIRELFPLVEETTRDVRSPASRQPASSPIPAGRSTRGSTVVRKRSVSSSFTIQLASLINSINSMDQHYIRCIKPNPLGQFDNFSSSYTLQQLRCAGLLDTIKIRKAGFSYRRAYLDFLNRFYVISPQKIAFGNPKQAVTQLLQWVSSTNSKFTSSWTMGNTKVFLKSDFLAFLEQLRESSIKKSVLIIDSFCKRHIRRKRWKHAIALAKQHKLEQERKRREEEERKRKEEEERKRKEEERKKEEAERMRREEEERKRKAEEERKRKDAEEQRKKMEEARKQKAEEERLNKEKLEQERKQAELQRNNRPSPPNPEPVKEAPEPTNNAEPVSEPKAAVPPGNLRGRGRGMRGAGPAVPPRRPTVESTEPSALISPIVPSPPRRSTADNAELPLTDNSNTQPLPTSVSTRGKRLATKLPGSPHNTTNDTSPNPGFAARPHAPIRSGGAKQVATPPHPVQEAPEIQAQGSIPPPIDSQGAGGEPKKPPPPATFGPPPVPPPPATVGPPPAPRGAPRGRGAGPAPRGVPSQRGRGSPIPATHSSPTGQAPSPVPAPITSLPTNQLDTKNINLVPIPAPIILPNSVPIPAPITAAIPASITAPILAPITAAIPVPITASIPAPITNADSPLPVPHNKQPMRGNPRGGAPRGRGRGSSLTASAPILVNLVPAVNRNQASTPVPTPFSKSGSLVKLPLPIATNSADNESSSEMKSPTSDMISPKEGTPTHTPVPTPRKPKLKLEDILINISSILIPKIEFTSEGDELHRQQVLHEFVLTEKAYLNDIFVLLEVFLFPIRNNNILSKTELKTIFGNIETLITVNIEIFYEMIKYFDDFEVKKDLPIGKIFLMFVSGIFYFFKTLNDFLFTHFFHTIQLSSLKVYTEYCINQPVAFNLLEEIKNQDKFTSFIKVRESDPRCHGLFLNSFLIKPTQRICKYPLLFAVRFL